MSVYGRTGANIVELDPLLALKQDKTDTEHLETTDKTIVGAINEVRDMVRDGSAKGALPSGFNVDQVVYPGTYWLNSAYTGTMPYDQPAGGQQIYSILDVTAASTTSGSYLTKQMCYRVDVGNGYQINYIYMRVRVGDNWSVWQTMWRADGFANKKVGDGFTIDPNMKLDLAPAASDKLGGVIISGGGLAMEQSGRLKLTPASESALGGVYIYQNGGLEVNENGGIRMKPATYQYMGGVIIDDSLEVTETGVLKLRSS